ncbi:hypothetical protein GCM10029978_075140 [Actinoallomurus acanthiterrae]
MNTSWHPYDFRPAGSTAGNAVRWGDDTYLDGRLVTSQLSTLLPPVAADLMEIATAVYSADRLTARARRDPYGLGWARRLRLYIAVRDPGRWTVLQERLSGLLNWLTDDEWAFEFDRARWPESPLDEPQDFLFNTVPDRAVAVLFSGGLDSTAGLARDIALAPDTTYIPVSVSTNSRMASCQETVLSLLRAPQLRPCRYRLHLGRGRSVETTQRTRGFLFLSAGIATALAAGLQRLRVYENGIGAINLPLIEGQHGSQATRAVHPRTLELMADLVSAASDSRFRTELPYLWSTKAEVVKQAPDSADEACARSISCDTGFASRIAGAHPCGACTSCVLRRQAVAAAGRDQLDAGLSYRSNTEFEDMPEGWAAWLWQVMRLGRSLVAADPWSSLAGEFPQVLDVPAADTEPGRAALLDLYGRYYSEWQAVGADLGVNVRRWGLERRVAG